MVIRLGELYGVPVYETPVGLQVPGAEDDRRRTPSSAARRAAATPSAATCRSATASWRPLLPGLHGPHGQAAVGAAGGALRRAWGPTTTTASTSRWRPEKATACGSGSASAGRSSIAGVGVDRARHDRRLPLRAGGRRLAAHPLLGHGAAAAHLHGGAGEALVPELLKAGRELAGPPRDEGGLKRCTSWTTPRPTSASTPRACAVASASCPSSAGRPGSRPGVLASPPTSRRSSGW